MANQATIDPAEPGSNGKGPSAAAGVRNGVGDVLHDIVSLGELQAQLLVVDARESVKQIQVPITLLIVGSVFALSALPILWISGAEAIHEVAHWSRWLSYLTSGTVGLAIGLILIAIAWNRSSTLFNLFDRSRVELGENVKWIKYALISGRRPPR